MQNPEKTIIQKLKDLSMKRYSLRELWMQAKAWFTANKVIAGLVLTLLLLIASIILRMFDTDIGCWLDRLLGITETKDISAKYKTIQTLGLALLGNLGLIGMTITYKRVKAQEDMIEKQEQANKDKTFNGAVKNLGHESASVRLGGIYTLCELRKTKPEWLRNIAEILCAHLRETTQQETYQNQKNIKIDLLTRFNLC